MANLRAFTLGTSDSLTADDVYQFLQCFPLLEELDVQCYKVRLCLLALFTAPLPNTFYFAFSLFIFRTTILNFSRILKYYQHGKSLPTNYLLTFLANLHTLTLTYTYLNIRNPVSTTNLRAWLCTLLSNTHDFALNIAMTLPDGYVDGDISLV